MKVYFLSLILLLSKICSAQTEWQWATSGAQNDLLICTILTLPVMATCWWWVISLIR